MTALTVHNAEIRTATVEVRTLMISGRQVTQAVFKQLIERELIAEDGQLNGDVWGWVNYHPGNCTGDDRHLHVVWQSGPDLFRAYVNLDVEWPRWIDTEAASRWADAKVREDAVTLLTGWTPMRDEFITMVLGAKVRVFLSEEARKVTDLMERLETIRRSIAEHGPFHLVSGLTTPLPSTAHLSGRSAAMEAARAAAQAARSRVPAGEALARLQREFDAAVKALPELALAEADEQLRAVVQEELDRRRQHVDTRRALSALPQLFIAAG